MPQKRTPNKAKGTPSTPILKDSSLGEIAGVVLVVVAVALAIAVLSPQSAPVARATAEALRICFGAGAIVVPVAILALALTFFVPTDAPLSARAAVGLAIVVVGILAMLSLFAEGAAADPALLLTQPVAEASGGFVGGALAWALLSSVGLALGATILTGLIASGLIVCGFSISGLMVRLRQMRNSAQARAAERRKAPSGDTLRRSEGVRAAFGERTRVLRDQSDVNTTFIGARKTSVLRRLRPVETPAERPVASPAMASASGGFDAAPAAPAVAPIAAAPMPVAPMPAAGAAASFDGTAALDLSARPEAPQVPEFLRNPKAKATSEPARPKPRARRRTASPARGRSSLPPTSMLARTEASGRSAAGKAELDATAARLQATLHEFGLQSRVVGYFSGPLVTTFQVEMGEGERVSRITNLEDDIALALAAESVRIFAPIPGTSQVGIEIPNQSRQDVRLGDIIDSATGGPLELAFGRDAVGDPVIEDLAKMPHLLIAGATGSGKSVMINAIIVTLIMRSTPEELRLILIDPKRVELGGYNGLPHLYVPVVTEPKKASGALAWAVGEMDRRLKLFERAGARDIGVYNARAHKAREAGEEDAPEPMPYLVIIVDELSDLMMVAGKDVESSIVRIAQLARAAGIHLILATQRPSADIVTGLIKANIENRVAFSVASGVDSRVILDKYGAERLLGRGDMLLKRAGRPTRRVLGAYVSDEEIAAVVAHLKETGSTDYHDEVLTGEVAGGSPEGGSADLSADDELFWDAARLVVESQFASTSMLQRKLKVGHSRAGRLTDMLESQGIVGPPNGSKPREVLVTVEELDAMMGNSR